MYIFVYRSINMNSNAAARACRGETEAHLVRYSARGGAGLVLKKHSLLLTFLVVNNLRMGKYAQVELQTSTTDCTAVHTTYA